MAPLLTPLDSPSEQTTTIQARRRWEWDRGSIGSQSTGFRRSVGSTEGSMSAQSLSNPGSLLFGNRIRNRSNCSVMVVVLRCPESLRLCLDDYCARTESIGVISLNGERLYLRWVLLLFPFWTSELPAYCSFPCCHFYTLNVSHFKWNVEPTLDSLTLVIVFL